MTTHRSSRTFPSKQENKTVLKPLLGAALGGVATVLAMRQASPIGTQSDIPTAVQWGPYAAAAAVAALTYKNRKFYGMGIGAALGAIAGAAFYAAENASYFAGAAEGIRRVVPQIPGSVPGRSPTGTTTSPFGSGMMV